MNNNNISFCSFFPQDGREGTARHDRLMAQ